MARKFFVAEPKDFQVRKALERTHLEKPGDPSPLEVYIALKSLYGEPNREFIDEGKQQWTFLLRTEGAVLEVYDWKIGSWSIAVFKEQGNQSNALAIANELVAQIKRTVARCGREIRGVTQRPIGQVIENPFTLYYETGNELLELAEELSSGRAADVTITEVLENWRKRSTLCRAAFFQYIAAVEGLLNLIYDLYLKRELRDDRILDRLSRENIDVKLRLAPIYCDCFAGRPIDHTTKAFKAFHSLANIRNDFIHANLTKSMRTPIVTHEGSIYAVESSTASGATLPRSYSELGIDELTDVKATIDAIVAQLVESMKPRVRRQFKSFMNDSFIHVAYEDGMPIVVG